MSLDRTRNIDGSGRPIRVLIVQSQRLIADALELLLNEQPDMIVCGKMEFGAGERIVEMARTARVVIIDFRIDVLAACEIASMIATSGVCAPGIIALTDDRGDGHVLRAIDAGARGVISESDRFASVVAGVRRVAQGLAAIPPGAVADLLTRRRLRDHSDRRMTRREAQLLALLAEGATSREIAQMLGISYVTVRTHIRNLATKLGAHSQVEMVARAYQLELVRRGRPSNDRHPAGAAVVK